MPEDYDQRRSRCMLDQSSNTQNPIHLVLGSPRALKIGYAHAHEEVRALLLAYDALAACTEPGAPAREELAHQAGALSARYAAAHMSALAELLGFFADFLRSSYPIRPVPEGQALEEIG